MRTLLLGMPDVISAFNLITRLPNLGIISIAGNTDKGLSEVRACDLTAVDGDIPSYVRNLITSYKPHLVGLSCMTFQHGSAMALAKLAKSIDQELYVVLGGYHPTIAYTELAQDQEVKTYVDFLVRGEGEKTFSELIEAIQGKRSIDQVDGLSYKHQGEFRHNGPRKPIELEQLRLPDRGARIIHNGFHIFGKRADVLETSRGCTLDCSFCCITQMYSTRFRRFSIERVLQDIESVRRNGVQSVLFVDDNITIDAARFEEICDAIIERGYNDLHYFVQASVSGIVSKKDLSTKMARAGFKCVFLGIENPSEKNTRLLDIGRKLRGPENVQGAVRLLKENDIIVFGGLIFGGPDDREADFRETLRLARELKLDIPVFYLLTPYPGTRLRAEAVRRGLIADGSAEWPRYDCFHPIRTNDLSADEVGFLHWKACESWFNHLSWLFYNKVKIHYPAYFIKMIADTWPHHLWKRILSTLWVKNERDLYMADMVQGRAPYSVLRRVQ